MPLVSSLFSFDPITQQHQHPSSMYFAKLQDSPMFRQQLQTMEEGAESLRARCWRFYKGCKKYTDGLLDACDGDFTFASALENFGGEHSDPLFVTLGGPVMTKFSMALRDISTFKDALRTQVEQMLTDRLLHIYNVEIMDVKEARKRFDKASIAYDQAREKFMSLRKSTRQDIVIAIEEELHNARSSFEEARFNLISALHNVEARKRFEFLEAVTGVMDAHLQYFRQGYELLHQLEPFIFEVLSYVQKARESHNEEQVSLFERMIEYKQLVHQESKLSLKGFYDSPGRDSPFSRTSSDVLDAVTESVKTGKVRSLTLDVKVWDSSVLSMFQSLGNLFANSVWEELLHSKTSTDDTLDGSSKGTRTKLFHARKPAYDDPISLKERFIHAKYSEKVFVRRIPNNNRLRTVAQLVWESIFANDKKSVYRHIVRSSVDINALNLNGQFDGNSFATPSSSHSSMSSETESQLMEDIKDGSSVLHLACLVSDAGMVELLLQYGADINAVDSIGRTPLHYCMFRGKIATAKLLILRGANTHVVDKQGKTPLMLASEPSSEIVGLISSR